MRSDNTYVISIAGFDPSGGAGILADIKTFETHKVIGLGVCTAITVQNEKVFKGIKWIDINEILDQIHVLFQLYKIQYLKIGIIESLKILNTLLDFLLKENPSLKIIWDPIIKTSSGYQFHNTIKKDLLKKILKKIYLITPNIDEYNYLFGTTDNIFPNNNLNILKKGGHNKGMYRDDLLIVNNRSLKIEGKYLKGYSKHGSGCVLSSAITANLAKGLELKDACKEAKKYIHSFLLSNKGLLGYHLK